MSLVDLFNPSFLAFLGILVLVAAVLVVYFETKLREQNHKITSMFSIVSTLAEDLNVVKYSLGTGGFPMGMQMDEQMDNHMGSQMDSQMGGTHLIEVSDDDESEIDDSDSESDSDSDNEEPTIKILNINMESNSLLEKFDTEELDNEGLDNEGLDNEELDNEGLDNEGLDNEGLDNEGLDNEELDNEGLDNEELDNEGLDNEGLDSEDNLTLEELASESSLELETKMNLIDYRKFSLQKLKTIVLERKLANDVSKLKKNELLKLLGVE